MKILICGDYIAYGTTAINNKTIFGDFGSEIMSADVAVYNQEFPVTDCCRIYSTKKHALTAASAPASLTPLQEIGFRYASLANNHIFNRATKGLQDTFLNLTQAGIKHFGAGVDLASASTPLFVTQKGVRVAFLGFAEHEYNCASSTHGGANPLDVVDNVRQIKAAKAAADHVFVIIHGGIDYCRYPSPRMVKQYRFYAEQGASAIIGHHSHVVSGYEVHDGTPIFYGIGSFIPGRIVNTDCEYSCPVCFDIDRIRLSFEIIPVRFDAGKQILSRLCNNALATFNREQQSINATLHDSDQLRQCILDTLRQQQRIEFYGTLLTRTPYMLYRIFRKLRMNHIYSKYMTNKMRQNKLNTTTWNLMRCETHRDVLDLLYETYVDTYTDE